MSTKPGYVIGKAGRRKLESHEREIFITLPIVTRYAMQSMN